MVGAISSTSLVSSTTTASSSDGASQKASLEAQIAAKKAELEGAKTDDDKQAITDEIAQLQARLQAIEAMEARKAEGQKPPPPPPAGKDESKIGTRNFGEDDGFGARQMWV